jgi:hypothetical protein
MARGLPPGFKLSEAPPSDSDAIWRLCEIAFADDEIWLATLSACDLENVHRWVMECSLPAGICPTSQPARSLKNPLGMLDFLPCVR